MQRHRLGGSTPLRISRSHNELTHVDATKQAEVT